MPRAPIQGDQASARYIGVSCVARDHLKIRLPDCINKNARIQHFPRPPHFDSLRCPRFFCNQEIKAPIQAAYNFIAGEAPDHR
jgi:hypothetical protein